MEYESIFEYPATQGLAAELTREAGAFAAIDGQSIGGGYAVPVTGETIHFDMTPEEAATRPSAQVPAPAAATTAPGTDATGTASSTTTARLSPASQRRRGRSGG